MDTDITPDAWYAADRRFAGALAALRDLVLGEGLDETTRWGQPTYVDGDRNVCMISERSAGATLSFLRGALLEDPDGRLISPGAASRHVRYLQFTGAEAVATERDAILAFLRQAVANERAGLRVPDLDPDDLVFVDVIVERMEADAVFAEAFEALTPGRQRGYDLHLRGAKQKATREARLARCTERILAGKGLHDCICGRSQRFPRCDGSHNRPA